jgi:hypothetical protein
MFKSTALLQPPYICGEGVTGEDVSRPARRSKRPDARLMIHDTPPNKNNSSRHDQFESHPSTVGQGDKVYFPDFRS